MPGWSSLGIALLLGFTLHGPVDFVQSQIEQLFPLPEALRAARAAGLSPSTLSERVLLMLAAAGLVPLAEEVFFRGALFVGLRRNAGISQAVVVSAVCFTLSHAEPRLWPALSVVAIVLSVMRQRTESLLPSILLHAGFNATTLVVTFSHPEALLEPSSPSLIWAAIGGALSVGLFLMLPRVAADPRGFR
jgi:hypothetical protein